MMIVHNVAISALQNVFVDSMFHCLHVAKNNYCKQTVESFFKQNMNILLVFLLLFWSASNNTEEGNLVLH